MVSWYIYLVVTIKQMYKIYIDNINFLKIQEIGSQGTNY